MSTYAMRMRDVRLEPYYQRYYDTRPMAAARGEMFTRPDTAMPTEQFFADLTVDEQSRILAWLVSAAADLQEDAGLQTSLNVDAAIMGSAVGRTELLRVASAATGPVTFEIGALPGDWTPEDANRMFQQIRERGHATALDNFGRPGNDDASLLHLDFDTVKIAGSLAYGVESDPAAQERIGRILEVLRATGRHHVVQGVESQAALNWLKGAGFTTFQGYWCNIPAPAVSLTHR